MVDEALDIICAALAPWAVGRDRDTERIAEDILAALTAAGWTMAPPVVPETRLWPDWGDRPDGFDGPTGAE